VGRQASDPYRYLTCGGCGRAIDQREHWGFPNEGTDPTHVHLIMDAAAPAYGVHCPCSHYTLYADPENLPTGLPKGMRMSRALGIR
jgi:hypothetical protein